MFINLTLKKLLLLCILFVFSFSTYGSEGGRCEGTFSLVAVLNVKIVDYFVFNTSIHKSLSDGKLIYVGELVQRTEEGLLDVSGLGKKSVGLIAEEIAGKDNGLSLGMELEDGWNQHKPSLREGTRRLGTTVAAAITRADRAVGSGVNAIERRARVAGSAVADAASRVTPSQESLQRASDTVGRGARVAGSAVAGAASRVTPSRESLQRASDTTRGAVANVSERMQANAQRERERSARIREESRARFEARQQPAKAKVSLYERSLNLGQTALGNIQEVRKREIKRSRTRGVSDKAVAESLSKPIENLNSEGVIINARALKEMKDAGIHTYEDLVLKTRKELVSVRFLGSKVVDNIEKVLAVDGLSIGMTDTKIEHFKLLADAASQSETPSQESLQRAYEGSLNLGRTAFKRIKEERRREINRSRTRGVSDKAVAESLSKPIENLNSEGVIINARTLKEMKDAGIHTYEDLVLKTRKELVSVRFLGSKVVDNIEKVLAVDGLSIGMTDTKIEHFKLLADAASQSETPSQESLQRAYEGAFDLGRTAFKSIKEVREREIKRSRTRGVSDKAVAESLSKPIENLNSEGVIINAQALKEVKDAGIHTYEDLVLKTRKELVSVRFLGSKVVDNIEKVLAVDGLSIGMTDTEIEYFKSFL